MKKVVFGLLACATFALTSCETNDTAAEDSLYETESIDRKIKKRNIRAIDRKIKKHNIRAIDRKIKKHNIRA